MSVIADGKGIAFSSSPWLFILGSFGVFLVLIVATVPYQYKRVERGRSAMALDWFGRRMRDPKAPLPNGFELKDFRERKTGWTATLTRLKSGDACPTEYGCYSMTFDSAKLEVTCSTEACTKDLLP